MRNVGTEMTVQEGKIKETERSRENERRESSVTRESQY